MGIRTQCTVCTCVCLVYCSPYCVYRVGTSLTSRHFLHNTSPPSELLCVDDWPPLVDSLCVALCRNTVEKEERKTLVNAGVNVTDRVFTPEEVCVYVCVI